MVKKVTLDDKIKLTVTELSKIDPSYGDFFDDLGILVDDVQQMLDAETKSEFQREKFDCKRTIKAITKKIQALSFKK